MRNIIRGIKIIALNTASWRTRCINSVPQGAFPVSRLKGAQCRINAKYLEHGCNPKSSECPRVISNFADLHNFNKLVGLRPDPQLQFRAACVPEFNASPLGLSECGASLVRAYHTTNAVCLFPLSAELISAGFAIKSSPPASAALPRQ